VLLSVPTFTLDLMVAPRALALSPSSLQTMLATPSSSSMVTTGKVAHLRFVKIALQELARDSVAVADSADVVVLEAASVLVEDLELVAASVEVSAVVVALAADMEDLPVVDLMPEPPQLLPTLSQTMLLLERRGAKPFMSAT
jgi:hypothetical protein